MIVLPEWLELPKILMGQENRKYNFCDFSISQGLFKFYYLTDTLRHLALNPLGIELTTEVTIYHSCGIFRCAMGTESKNTFRLQAVSSTV